MMAIVVPLTGEPQPEKPDVNESYLLMAAANMHQMGRLIQRDAEVKLPSDIGTMTKDLTKQEQHDLKNKLRRDPGEEPITPAYQIEERFPTPAEGGLRQATPTTRIAPERARLRRR